MILNYFFYLCQMKKSISISLALLLLWISIQQVGVVIYFKINQSYIETQLCENKDKPELACHGKCSLKKELEKTSSESKQKSVLQTIELPFLWTGNYETCPMFFLNTPYQEPFHKENLSDDCFFQEHLKPPIFRS